jgi:Rho GTPase-activating protein RGD1
VIGPCTLGKVPPTSADLEATNLDAEEWSGDISNVTSVLKLWLRDLPEPLLTLQLHQGFLDAASEFPL